METQLLDALKYYQGRIPACGVFCGGCPVYVRAKKPCPGAELNFHRCENCKTFHLCCKERNITNCFQCNIFPCYKFKRFAKNWLKYGQDLISNQHLLREIGHAEFLKHYNSKINNMNTVNQFCQSCGMPLESEAVTGTNEDGSKNNDYCVYCYQDGKFTADCSMDEMIAISLKHMKELFKNNPDFDEQKALANMNSFFPKLKRWA